MYTLTGSTSEKAYYFIGKVAEMTGASCKAIRHYEELALLPPPARRGAYRVYSDKDVFMVHVIKHAQAYNFSLNELRELIATIAQEDQFPVEAALAMVAQKQASVRREVEALCALDQRLEELQADIKIHFR